METNIFLEKVLSSFQRYYTIKTSDITAPFTAEAEFHSHGEQYVLVKAAKIAEVNSHEYVYFKTQNSIDLSEIKKLAEKAWSAGLSRVEPFSGHRNSDVVLVIIAENIDEAAKSQIKKIKYSKSYKFSFYGWSNFKLVVKELGSNQVYCNRLGRDLKKTLSKIN